MKVPSVPANQLLPAAIRDALRVAAMTPVTPADPLARQRAINKVIERARRSYPDYFRSDWRSA